MQTYDVALWRYWPDFHLPVVDYVEAETPLLAVLSLMATHKLKHVARAAVGLPDGGGIKRYEKGVGLHMDESHTENVTASPGEEDTDE